MAGVLSAWEHPAKDCSGNPAKGREVRGRGVEAESLAERREGIAGGRGAAKN